MLSAEVASSVSALILFKFWSPTEIMIVVERPSSPLLPIRGYMTAVVLGLFRRITLENTIMLRFTTSSKVRVRLPMLRSKSKLTSPGGVLSPSNIVTSLALSESMGMTS